MFGFVGKLFRTAAADAVRSMGTTALAAAVGVVAWIVTGIGDVRTGGVQAALAHWDYALLWTVGAWLALLAFHVLRHFRPLLREHHRVFRLVTLDQDQHSDPDRISIWCLLKFCKDLKPVDLTVRVTTLPPVGDPITSVVHTETLEKVTRDQVKRLRLGSLRIGRPNRPAYHSIWGSEVGTEDLKPGQRTIIPGSTKNLISISVGPQTYRCYIEFVASPPGALAFAMYMTDEDRSPWIQRIPD